mmetsp:Transcript_30933/g.63191  ORF Transcript_30933/g.63191 Transcript_30933/m.63191 type:complete len:273 (+) Transcript_30933:262-1080(+)
MDHHQQGRLQRHVLRSSPQGSQDLPHQQEQPQRLPGAQDVQHDHQQAQPGRHRGLRVHLRPRGRRQLPPVPRRPLLRGRHRLPRFPLLLRPADFDVRDADPGGPHPDVAVRVLPPVRRPRYADPHQGHGQEPGDGHGPLLQRGRHGAPQDHQVRHGDGIPGGEQGPVRRRRRHAHGQGRDRIHPRDHRQRPRVRDGQAARRRPPVQVHRPHRTQPRLRLPRRAQEEGEGIEVRRRGQVRDHVREGHERQGRKQGQARLAAPAPGMSQPRRHG